MDKYFVICSMDDCGVEFNSYDDALKYCCELQESGSGEEPVIVGPGIKHDFDPSWA